MRRREFITALGGAAIWPLAALAQQAGTMRRIGMLLGAPQGDPETNDLIETFRKAIQALGWSEQRNVHLEWRIASDVHSMEAYASELVKLGPDAIVAYPTPATAAIKRTRTQIPVVFVNVSDPIGSGFVASLARPGGSITGFTNFESSMGGKWLQLLREIASTTRVALLFNPDTASGGAAGGVYLESAKAAADQTGSKLIVSPVYDEAGIEATFKSLAGDAGGGGVIVNPNVFTATHRMTIVMLAARYKVPAIYPYRSYAEIGGLISYGVERRAQFRGAAGYVDRILRGTQPRDLPVQQPTAFELVVNLKTAKALGVDVPPTLLARADDVIE